jgi:creatinine amidohydrolase
MKTQSVPIAILPLGAHEQHGPHLPFETDALIAGGRSGYWKQPQPDHVTVELLPVEPVGYSIEHMDVTGTRTLAFDEAVNRWIGIAGGCAARGLRRLHAAQRPWRQFAAADDRRHRGTSSLQHAGGGNQLDPLRRSPGHHLGRGQGLRHSRRRHRNLGHARSSSRFVRHEAIRDFPSRQAELPRRFKHLRAYGPHAFGWKMSDLNVEGAAGNASRATAEKGEVMLDHAVSGLTELLADMAEFDVDELG